MNDVFKRLAAPFPAESVYWRVGATDNRDNPTRGVALAYIDARNVMDRLDEVIGPGNWSDEYEETPAGRIICTIEIHAEFSGTYINARKSDGAGKTDYEGDKGAISDAFKRAAVKWGIGRYLYRLDSPWVPVEKKGKTVRIKKGFEPTLPPWALPGQQESDGGEEEGAGKGSVAPVAPADAQIWDEEMSRMIRIPSDWPTHVYNTLSGLVGRMTKEVGHEATLERIGRLLGLSYGVEGISELSKKDAKAFIEELTKMVELIEEKE